MNKVKALLLVLVMATLQATATNREINQQEVYESLYALLQMSYDDPGDIGFEYVSLDITRNLVILNDESSDEIYCCWEDVGLPDINRSIFKSNQPQIADIWNILFYGINRCNYFLEIATGTDETTLLQRAEAQFIRAYLYSIALDLWGGVPIYTSSDKTQKKARNTGSEVFDFIVSELYGCMPSLPLPSATAYGKPSQTAAQLLLARLYLNAEVYTGTARWAQAKQQAQTVINGGWYSLCSDYARLFMADNDTNGAQNETVWPLIVDGNDLQNWGNTMFLIASTHDNDMPSCGMDQSWAGQVVRQSLLKKFFPNDDCPSASTADILQAAGDDRCLFYGVGRPYGSAPFDYFTDGFSCVKYTNLCSDGSVITYNGHADTDFPLLRYAEAYLIFAEADARLNNGVCSNEGLQVLNTLRQRAHAAALGSASLGTIADEWVREFYLEGRRRSDLVRFGLFSGNTYVWDGKSSPVRDLLPIPDQELARNPFCSQNPGYENSLKEPVGLAMITPEFANETIDLRKVQGLWFRWQRPENFDVDESVTYGLQLSADADFTGNVASINVENVEKMLLSHYGLYQDLGLLGIADGDTAQVYARVACHGVASEPVAFSICRSKIEIPPHTWYILGFPIGDGMWNNNANGLGVSCVPLGVVGKNTFRFSGYFTTDGFKLIRNLADWEEQIGSYTGSIDDYSFNNSASSNLQFNAPGNYTLTVHYDGVNNYLLYERLSDDLPVYSSISMIGGFTDWGSDVDMTRVEGVNHSWYTRLTLHETTQLKFRANHEWNINWGAESFPYGQALREGNNLEVKPGDYMVFFNDITGDYLFLDGRYGVISGSNDPDIVDNMFLNTGFATIEAMNSITFQAESEETTVPVVDTTGQSVEALQLLVGDYKLLVDANGTVFKEQLIRIINQINNKNVTTDAANHLRTTSVEAVLRGYCDKNDVRVYTESAPFTIVMEEEFHLQLADAYYYLGMLNDWDITDRSIPFTKVREGVFALMFTQPAGVDHWFKVMPSTTEDWSGDFVYPAENGTGLGTGTFYDQGNSNTWYIPANETHKTYGLILDFTTRTYTLGLCDVNDNGEVDVADIATVIRAMYSNHSAKDQATAHADVNGDGVVDTSDIAALIIMMSSK